jgi:DNA helicase-2/ATP-dependent DNA helicase PcrA
LDCIAGASEASQAVEGFKPPAAAAEWWPSFASTFGNLRRRTAGWPAELDLTRQWYAPHLERLYEDATVRQVDLAQLSEIALGYASRERFLTELTLDPPDATSGEAATPRLDEDYLILSTIHSAKGQEWKSVFVLNTVDGCIPSDLGVGTNDEIEEERRLLYVAMTRAKDQLHLVVPQRFYVHGQRGNGDRHVYAQRTRFIPASITRHFESCTWPIATPETLSSTVGRAKTDVGAKLRGMWG